MPVVILYLIVVIAGIGVIYSTMTAADAVEFWGTETNGIDVGTSVAVAGMWVFVFTAAAKMLTFVLI